MVPYMECLRTTHHSVYIENLRAADSWSVGLRLALPYQHWGLHVLGCFRECSVKANRGNLTFPHHFHQALRGYTVCMRIYDYKEAYARVRPPMSC